MALDRDRLEMYYGESLPPSLWEPEQPEPEPEPEEPSDLVLAPTSVPLGQGAAFTVFSIEGPNLQWITTVEVIPGPNGTGQLSGSPATKQTDQLTFNYPAASAPGPRAVRLRSGGTIYADWPDAFMVEG